MSQPARKTQLSKVELERMEPQDRERLLLIAMQILAGDVDTMLVRKDFKSSGRLWIKGMNYAK